MKYVSLMILSIVFLVFTACSNAKSSMRDFFTLAPEEAAKITGGAPNLACGPVNLCYRFTLRCPTSTIYRCNEKYQEVLLTGPWVDCNVNDPTKTACYSTAVAICVEQYSCVWNEDLGCIWDTTQLYGTLSAPQICGAGYISFKLTGCGPPIKVG